MRTALAIVFFVVSVSVASSEPIRVRSGMHDGFTRLVFYLPARTEWSLNEKEGGATVVVAPRERFDIADVYDRIDRVRLSDIRTGKEGGAVEIQFGCDCTMRTEVLVGNVLVLDIVDPPGNVTTTASNGGETDGTSVSRPAGLRPPSKLSDAKRLTQTLTLPFGGSEEADTLERSRQLASVEAEMLEEVARAATQGLLSTHKPGGPQRQASATKLPSVGPDKPDASPAPPPPVALAHTSLSQSDTSGLKLTSEGESCRPDKDFDLASWAGADGFSAGLGTFRTQLTGEFDDINPEAAVRLARFYVAHGFGAEALSTLNSTAPEGKVVLRSLARIVDAGYDPAGAPFAKETDCDTHAALWAVMSLQRLTPKLATADRAILRTLNALPLAVRSHVGVTLAKKFLDAGQDDMSRALLRIVDRNKTGPDIRHEAIAGQIELKVGNEQEGRETLSATADRDREISPLALIALIEHDLASGVPVSAERADLISAFVFQYRSASLSQELKKLEILARASAGQLDTAFSLLRERTADGSINEELRDLQSRTTDFLIANPDDTLFLRHGLTQARKHAADLYPDTANALAERFLALGFPGEALEILTYPASGLAQIERRLLRARAALDTGDVDLAEDELATLINPEADALRAEIRSAKGQHAAASEIYGRIGRTDRSERQAWLASDWETLRSSDDGLNAALAALQVATPDAPEDEGELARNRRLLGDSEAARSTLTEALSRFVIPQDSTN